MKQQGYQEALDKLIQDYNDLIQQSSNLSQYYEWYDTQEKIDKLQELVDKETPMRVIKLAENKYSCQKCAMAFELKTSISNMFVNNQYCNVCGQHIDWSGGDE